MKGSLYLLVGFFSFLPISVIAAADTATTDFVPQVRELQPLPRSQLPLRPAINQAWYSYRQGVVALEEGRLDKALTDFKEATIIRIQSFSKFEKDLQLIKATGDGRGAGDSIAALLQGLVASNFTQAERLELKAGQNTSLVQTLTHLRSKSPRGNLRIFIEASLAVLDEWGEERIGNSFAKLQEAAIALQVFPEAHQGIARVFLAEGEAALAEEELQKAYKGKAALVFESDVFPLLESIADIQLLKNKGQKELYEASLKEALLYSRLFTEKSHTYRQSIEKVLRTQGLDSFMKLYRLQPDNSENALLRLALYYLENKNPEAVLYFAAGTNIIVTKILGWIRITEPLFTYTNLPNLRTKLESIAELSDYARKAKLWENLRLLAQSLGMSGSEKVARDIIRDLT